MAFYEGKKSASQDITFTEGGPCPVCGDPTGNCKGDSGFAGAIDILPPAKEDPFATFTVPERIYDVEVVNGRTRKKLVYAKGDRIRPDEAKRRGLM